jgi:hypothetical protein
VTAPQVRALGAALGYPSCCIDAFIPIRDRSTPAIQFHALRRTPGRAALLLNDITVPGLVSHCVCRYDCSASLEYARALFHEIARLDPNAAEALRRSLGGIVVLFRRGGALRLVSDTPAAEGTHRFGPVDVTGTGPRLEQWRTALHGADGLEVLDARVRLLRGTEETCRLDAPANEVQVRPFA